MRTLFILIITCFISHAWSQNVDLRLLSTAGSYFNTSEVSLVWSMGELSVNSSTNATGSLQEGHIQNLSSQTSTAISTILLEEEVTISPNPSASFATIRTAYNQMIDYTLLDILGKRISEGTFVKQSDIDLRALESGVYIIHLRTKEGKEGIYSLIKA